jgi:ABC-type amino acid transport substrate-binding protein
VHRFRFVPLVLAVVVAGWPASPTVAQPAPAGATPPAGVLVIGTKDAPPFAMKGEDGEWTGISIELWREVADRLDLAYEFREYDLEGLLDAVEQGQVAAGVAALTITQEREEVMDFTHPIYSTGYGIALPPVYRPGWKDAVAQVVSSRFLGAAGLLALTLVLAGSVVWLFERRANPEQFGGRGGVFAGVWWAAVTMSTVGYGDKVPRTLPGKLFGIVWIFFTVAVLGTFIASMSSALTVTQLQSPIRGPEDLAKARVATVRGSASQGYLQANRIPFQPTDDLRKALQSVADRRVDAVVYDAPLMRYLVSRDYQDRLDVLPRTFGRLDYCFALPSGSLLREPVNRVLLSAGAQSKLRDILFRFLEQAPALPARPDGGEEDAGE